MKKLVIFLLVIAALIGAAWVAIPMLVSKEKVVAMVAEQVKAKTGRDLKITGDVSVGIWPNIAVNLGDVSLSNAPWASDPTMLTMKKLSVSLQVMPLLKKEIRVDELTLIEPVVFLEKNAKGQANWQFETAYDLLSRRVNVADNAPAQQQAGAIPALAAISLSKVTIENGSINYQDKASKTAQSVHELDLKLGLKNLSDPLELDAKAEFQGKPISVKGNLASVQRYLDGEAPAVKAELTYAGLKTVFDGTLNPSTKAPGVQGNMVVNADNLADVLGKFGIKTGMPDGTLKNFMLKGALRANEAEVALEHSHLVLDAVELDGTMRANIAGKTPAIRLDLAGPALDLSPYFPKKQADGSAWMPSWISDAHAEAMPYSTEAFDLKALKSLDFGGKFKFGKLIFHQFTLSNVVSDAVVKNGRANFSIPAMQLFSGAGDLEVTLDANGTPALTLASKLTGIQVEPLLIALNNIDKLTGKGNAVINVSGTGTSVQGIMNSLGGMADIRLKDGKIKGIDLAQAMRDLKSVFNPARDSTPRSTDFSEFGGSFAIKQGVAHTEDLAMMAPFARLTAQGDVDIARQRFDMKVQPRVVGSMKGQGGELNNKGLMVPLKVSGPFNDPSIAPDLEAIQKEVFKPENIQKAIQDPKAAKEQIKELGKQLNLKKLF
ncbi:AsmA family protein [bacterium]|nr:AsmA family protein [bacterium]